MARRKVSSIPTSKAKTAYDLLTEVRALILAEPRRYNQQRFIARVGADRDEADEPSGELYPKGAPACGTVACVAGWIATLKVGAKFKYEDTERIAADALGLNQGEAWALFTPGAIPERYEVQTVAYAKAGAAHIARFQKRYERQLKAKAV